MDLVEVATPLPFAETQERRLSGICAACFMLILQLRATQRFGDAGVLRQRVKDLLDRAEREALRARIASEDIQMAKFALIAFIDETIFASDWPQKDHWMAKPLQLELYDRYDAGEAFFVRLEQLGAQPDGHPEVLEVYYLCMALGFKGRYQLHGQEQLRTLIEDTYAQLSRAPGIGARGLAPHGKPRDQIATEVKSKLPTWVLIVCAVAIGLFAYLSMHFYISNVADDTALAIDQAARAEMTR